MSLVTPPKFNIDPKIHGETGSSDPFRMLGFGDPFRGELFSTSGGKSGVKPNVTGFSHWLKSSFTGQPGRLESSASSSRPSRLFSA